MCALSRHQGNYKENYIFISIANCLVNLLNISLLIHFVQKFSLKKVKQALFNVTACCSSKTGNNNHITQNKPHPGLLLKFYHCDGMQSFLLVLFLT